MEIEVLLQYLLPKEIIEYFDFKEIVEKEDNKLHLYLDEKSIKPTEHSDKDLIANGFDEPVSIQDFPIRKVTLVSDTFFFFPILTFKQ